MEAAHGPHGPSCLYEGQGRAAQAPDVLPPRAAPQGRQARRRGPAHVSTAGTYLHCGPAKSADDGGHFFVSRYCLINLSDDPITVDLDGGDPNEEVRIAEVWTLDAPGPDSRGESVRGGHCIPVFLLYSCCTVFLLGGGRLATVCSCPRHHTRHHSAGAAQRPRPRAARRWQGAHRPRHAHTPAARGRAGLRHLCQGVRPARRGAGGCAHLCLTRRGPPGGVGGRGTEWLVWGGAAGRRCGAGGDGEEGEDVR